MVFSADTQFDRLMMLSDLLQGIEGPATVGAIAMSLNERTGRPVCNRTVHRDLRFLHSRGFVQATGLTGKRGGPGARWQWIQDRQLLRA
jgi:repressor of nif and glnA expression